MNSLLKNQLGLSARNQTRNFIKEMLFPEQPRVKKYIKKNLVGVEGFEPPTSCSQSRRATRLRYTPKLYSNNEAVVS